jgi:hypothetical protein
MEFENDSFILTPENTTLEEENAIQPSYREAGDFLH